LKLLFQLNISFRLDYIIKISNLNDELLLITHFVFNYLSLKVDPIDIYISFCLIAEGNWYHNLYLVQFKSKIIKKLAGLNLQAQIGYPFVVY